MIEPRSVLRRKNGKERRGRTSKTYAGEPQRGSTLQGRSIVKNSVKRVLLSVGRVLPGKAVPILLYHSVDDSQMEDSVSPAVFLRQMEYLCEKGYRVISLGEIANYRNTGNGERLSMTLAITFDDGYRSLYRHAAPILRRFGFPATVFLPTKHVGGHSEWVHPSAPLLTWKEILAMETDGILFGSHGHSHRDLTALTQEQVREELETSKKILEDKLGKPVAHIAYPFSKSNAMVEHLALECGYRMSFSAIGVEKSRPPRGSSIVLRRSIMKKDDMLAFKFVLASTYPCYFDLQRLLRFRRANGHDGRQEPTRRERGIVV